jgi:hypothetical protein
MSDIIKALLGESGKATLGAAKKKLAAPADKGQKVGKASGSLGKAKKRMESLTPTYLRIIGESAPPFEQDDEQIDNPEAASALPPEETQSTPPAPGAEPTEAPVDDPALAAGGEAGPDDMGEPMPTDGNPDAQELSAAELLNGEDDLGEAPAGESNMIDDLIADWHSGNQTRVAQQAMQLSSANLVRLAGAFGGEIEQLANAIEVHQDSFSAAMRNSDAANMPVEEPGMGPEFGGGEDFGGMGGEPMGEEPMGGEPMGAPEDDGSPVPSPADELEAEGLGGESEGDEGGDEGGDKKPAKKDKGGDKKPKSKEKPDKPKKSDKGESDDE